MLKSAPLRTRRSGSRRSTTPWTFLVPLAVGVVIFSVAIFYAIVVGKTRHAALADVNPQPIIGDSVTTSTPSSLLPRRLDGVLVGAGQEALPTYGVMIDNQVDARPQSGPAKAQIGMEAPVEGGITRLFLLFDATATVAEVGPVRSARPYFIDWAAAWAAMYFHVGGSPDGLAQIAHLGSALGNVDEMTMSDYFWRAPTRYAPHNTYTSQTLMQQAALDKGFGSSTAVVPAWHFQDAVTTTARGGILHANIAYGGSYSVSWRYNPVDDVYSRYHGTQLQRDRDGSPVQSENVIVLKTEAATYDEIGRLRLRTTGSGDALAYRDGNRYAIRWHRSPGETIRLENQDGSEFLLHRGRVWLQITTDDRSFAGLGM